jgi:hypothetical protein
MANGHKWAFKTKLRARAFGWRGSQTAAARLKEAVAEIKTVGKSNPLVAGEGALALMERLWPAFEQIDTSSGALGSAVNKALGVLIPILIMAPADPKTRAKWLERLYQAVLDDGVQYLFPVEQRWGEIAVYPELMNEYADLLTPSLQRVWSDSMPGGYLVGGTIGLSCLLEVGRYGDLLDLLATSRHRFWSDHRFGAEALARQGLVDAAIAYADGCRDPKLRSYDERAIDRFCEALLLRSGRVDKAYQRYGLRTGVGSTYLAIYRDTVRSYPGRDKRQLLLDLIQTRGEAGKWFAAAKDAGFLDIALECARSMSAEPATLIRAVRDNVEREPEFAVQVAVIALRSLLAGGGYDPIVTDLHAAVGHLMAAARRIGREDWAWEQVQAMVAEPCSPGREHMRTALRDVLQRGMLAPAAGN